MKLIFDKYREEYQVLGYKQFDSLEPINATFLNNGEPIDLSQYYIRFQCKKPDGNVVVDDESIIVKNVCEIEMLLHEQVTVINGVVKGEFILIHKVNERQNATFTFDMEIQQSVIGLNGYSYSLITVAERFHKDVIESRVLHEALTKDIEVGNTTSKDLVAKTSVGNATASDLVAKTNTGNATASQLVEKTTLADQKKTEIETSTQIAVEKNDLLVGNTRIADDTNIALNQTITSGKDSIDKINATGNKSLIIGGSQFINNEYTWTHAMNNDNLMVNFMDSNTNEPLMPDYKVLDKNNILIRNSVEHPNVKVILSASFYQGNALFGTNVEEFKSDSIGVGAKKVRLKDGNGVVENPVTDSDAVFMPDGSTKLTKKIEEVTTQLEHIKNVKVTAEQLGMLPNTDITSVLNSLSNEIRYEIEFIKGAEYFLSDTITLDIFRHSIDGNGCIWSSIINDDTKWTVKLQSSLSSNPGVLRNGGSPAANIVNNFKNVILQTKNESTYYRKSNGLFFDNSIGKVSHLILTQIAILGFNKGVGFGSNSYMITFDKPNINYCNTCIALEKGFSDYGERINFSNGCIGDSNLMILNTTDQALHFHNMSFDFSSRLFENSGQLYFTNCHFEAPQRFFDITNDDKKHWGIIKDTGSVFISTSRIMVAYKQNEVTQIYLPYLFKAESESCSLNLLNCHTHIFADYMLNDLGICKVSQTHRYNTYSPFCYAQQKENLFIDENCTKIGNILSSDISVPVIIDDGYKCTHKSDGVNQQHIIKLPKLSSHFKIQLYINTAIKEQFFFNNIYIRNSNNTQDYYKEFGTFSSNGSQSVLTIHSYINREEGRWFNPNSEFELVLNTFNLPDNTSFTINKIIVNQLES